MYKCNNPECGIADGISCEKGYLHMTDCEDFIKSDETDGQLVEDTSKSAYKVFWSGTHLGFKGLQKLSDVRKPLIIGIVGPAEAGKSTILLSLYLQILSGKKLKFGDFWASYTLESWEALAKNSRFASPLSSPDFPPRTPRGDARTPGFLHLSFRNENDVIRDVIFIDAPGEWFNQWAANPNLAQGANWVITHSDLLIITSDSEKLSHKDARIRGSTRNDISSIFDRLKDYHYAKHIALVWTKAEENNNIPKTIRDLITRNLNSINFCSTSNHSCSITQPDEMFNIINELISNISVEHTEITDHIIGNSIFESFRGSHG